MAPIASVGTASCGWRSGELAGDRVTEVTDLGLHGWGERFEG
jgi:hypothetical protein